MSPSLRGSVDVSPEMQHREDILSDMVSSVPLVIGLTRSWMDRENGLDVVLLSQMDLNKHNPGLEVPVHRTLIWCG